ncbi:MAG: Rne/Rng family ribonuclease, partial [Nitrospinales bacterium]
GPTLTNFLTIPGRFLVLMQGNVSGGVSRKIEDEEERKKLKDIIKAFQLPDKMGVIIRTAGMGRTKLELQKDLQMLLKVWKTIENKAQDKAPPPFLVYQVPDMVERTVRDHYTADTAEIVVDNPAAYKTLESFFKLVMPRMRNRLRLYSETKPLFYQYQIEEQIESIYERKVNLPSGGSLVFDVGEALVAIDVNSGKTTGHSELEDTALKTNLEAAEEAVRQLRLRDLGGLVVIDFIDMYQKKNRSLLEKQIKHAFKKDKARINLSRLSKFGLLELSRQRLSPPVKESAFDRCAFCEGTGLVKSKSSKALDVLRRIQGIIAANPVHILSAEVSSELLDYLLNNKMRFLVALEEKHHVKILFHGKPGLRHEDTTYTILETKKEEKTQESRSKESQTSVKAETKAAAPREGETAAKRKYSPARKARSVKKTMRRKQYTRRPAGSPTQQRRSSSRRQPRVKSAPLATETSPAGTSETAEGTRAGKQMVPIPTVTVKTGASENAPTRKPDVPPKTDSRIIVEPAPSSE